MDERRSRLGSRFKRAVEKAEDERTQSQRSAKEADARAGKARAELFDEVEALANEIGSLGVQRTRQGLTLRYRERYLHFGPEGRGDVLVEFEGTGDDVHRLYREQELGARWVYVRKQRFREVRLPLFDQGVEDLLVTALGLPRPDDGDEGGAVEGGAPDRRL